MNLELPMRLDARHDARADAELALAVLAGDASAFEALMRRHNRLLLRTARGLVDDDAQAQDVVQDAWLRAFTHMAAWRGEAALPTWLVRITINVALAALRRRKPTVSLDDEESTVSDHPVDERADDSEGPEQQAARTQLREQLQAALAALAPKYRSVFMLRAVQDLNVEDCAAVLGVSPDVVKTRYLRARAQLREQLRGDWTAADAAQVFAYDGRRCDAVVATVMARVRQLGLLRGH